jgi:hypothetical protein
VIETLTTEQVILLGTNNVYYTKRAVFDILSEDYLRNTSLILISTFSYYHWVDTSAGELLVPKGITRSVVSVMIIKLFRNCKFQ